VAVPVVDIWIVRMLVTDRPVPVPVGMGYFHWSIMVMSMVVIMDMSVLVLERLVLMHVIVLLG
jgi:hypothetical protein